MDEIDSERTKVLRAYRDPRPTFLSFPLFFFLVLSYFYFVPQLDELSFEQPTGSTAVRASTLKFFNLDNLRKSPRASENNTTRTILTIMIYH